MTLDERDFRTACGHFATGITVVTIRGADGSPHGFTANSFTSVSLDPPLVLVCVDRRISSYEPLLQAEGFLVNVLSDLQEETCRRFATADIDKFAGIQTSDGPFGAPRIEGCIAYIGARRVARHEGGDHDIFVAEATEYEVRDGLPLLFFKGQYGLGGASESR